jgi:hypothetical protein
MGNLDVRLDSFQRVLEGQDSQFYAVNPHGGEDLQGMGKRQRTFVFIRDIFKFTQNFRVFYHILPRALDS